MLFILMIASCKKQSYYQVNPNTPSTATPALLLADICHDVFYYNLTAMTNPAYASRQITYYQDGTISAVTYGWAQSGYGNYNVLEEVEDMNTRAQAAGQTNYQALAHFFRAVLFSQLTETFGDVPYSEALQALNGIVTPKYDAQENIYTGILQELDSANNMLDPSQGVINGDIIYGGNSNEVTQWKQLVNAFHLRLLMHLSKKVGNTQINVQQQFQDIVSNPTKYPLMASEDDNAQIVFNTSATSNYYPFYLNATMTTSVSMEQGFVDTLKAKSDPRLFSFAAPVTGQPANVFSSYVGVNEGLSVGDQQTASGSASRLNTRYLTNQTNEPYIFLSYAEQEFLIAEAISRNWVTGAGAAGEYYNNGITASMAFYGITGSAVTNYLAQPGVAFDPNNAITMIITQKQIAFFLNSGWEPFYEQRRTGIPVMDVGPGTLNGGLVPKRWLYPQNEYTINATNVNAALQSQYGGTDDINGVMWLLK